MLTCTSVRYVIKLITYEVRNCCILGNMYLYKDICTHCCLCILLAGLHIDYYHLPCSFHSWQFMDHIQFLNTNWILQMYKNSFLNTSCICFFLDKIQERKVGRLQWANEKDQQKIIYKILYRNIKIELNKPR